MVTETKHAHDERRERERKGRSGRGTRRGERSVWGRGLWFVTVCGARVE